MKTITVGFIGAGNMAAAIIEGAIDKKAVAAQNIYVYDIDTAKLTDMKDRLGVTIAESMSELVAGADIVVLAVKPNVIHAVLQDIKDIIGGKAVVSIAAGWSADMIRAVIGLDKKVLRLMPNTPLMVGKGATVVETPHSLTADEYTFIENMFASNGLVDHAPQKLMDAVTAVSGSGPAYVFLFIEALADAGVLCGLPRAQALTLASQTVLGAASMVLETGSHPGALKDAVCSPGGTTIEAVKSLEQHGFRGAIISAVEQCANKAKAISEII